MELNKVVDLSKKQSVHMASLSNEQKNTILTDFSKLLLENKDFLIEENKKDLAEQKNKIHSSLYSRLKLDEGKVLELAQGMLDLTKLPDPCNQTLSNIELDEGLQLQQVSVPIGLIAVIFESRPDVIPQILSLMIKSGNCCLLKGGKEALHSNKAFFTLVEKLKSQHPELPSHWALFIETRDEVSEILKLQNTVDLIIPRGSNQLVQHIFENTNIPVLGHADGVCHLYIDDNFNSKMATSIIVDAKTQYPSACNAVETVLVHKNIAATYLPELAEELRLKNVKLYTCPQSKKIISSDGEVTDWHTEYSDLALSLRIVDHIEHAIEHINQYGSHHTDGIISTDSDNMNLFKTLVDSSSVMLNASTRFADGFRYGKGAEVGISTNKTHARGPVGIEGLVIYKYILKGKGQVVSDYTGENKKTFRHKRIK